LDWSATRAGAGDCAGLSFGLAPEHFEIHAAGSKQASTRGHQSGAGGDTSEDKLPWRQSHFLQLAITISRKLPDLHPVAIMIGKHLIDARYLFAQIKGIRLCLGHHRGPVLVVLLGLI
jgi:hypothetical protein